MLHKFSGECWLELFKEEKVTGFSTFKIVGEYPDLVKELDDYIEEALGMMPELELLKDGEYHTYFVGTLEWIESYDSEGNRDYTAEIVIEYVNFFRME
jgi:hypothetical protein